MPSEPLVAIRRYEAADNKLVRFMVGKANMELLAVANRRGYVHPLTLSLWLGLSSVLIEVLHMWPTTAVGGLLGYLKPLPILAAAAVPILFLIDWLNRAPFEQNVQDVLRAPDLRDISSHYSHPSSGFWLLDYGDRFVGLIALDASGNPEVKSQHPNPSKKVDKKSKTPLIGTIRHFYVDEAFRGSGIQEDLLAHAVNTAFQSNTSLQCIKSPDSPLISYISVCLREAGFELESITGKIGVFKWQQSLRVLQRESWEKLNKVL